MRWTVHIPCRPVAWRGLLSAFCYLYSAAHGAPAMTDSGACHCSCRRGALCLYAYGLKPVDPDSSPSPGNPTQFVSKDQAKRAVKVSLLPGRRLPHEARCLRIAVVLLGVSLS